MEEENFECLFNALSGKKKFTVRSKSAENKKFFDFDENWYYGISRSLIRNLDSKFEHLK